MKIYFAGEPGGNKREREQVMYVLEVQNRLQSFFYFEQLKVTMEVINENISGSGILSGKCSR